MVKASPILSSPLVLPCLYHLFSLNLPILTRWFAKRFLHPDIVAEYDYVFLWDEDIGVDHFNPKRYLFLYSAYELLVEHGSVQQWSFLCVDIYQLWNTKDLKYHSQHWILVNQRCIIKLLHAGGDRLCTGFSFFSFFLFQFI